MTNKTEKVCITGAWYSSKNVGDQAILITITDQIKKFAPNAKFTIFSSNPKFVTQEHGFESLSPRHQPLKSFLSLAKADLLIIGGGTPFYDDLIHMLHFSFMVFVAKVFKTRTMVYAASTRELTTGFGKFLTKYILNNVDLASIREPDTVLRLQSLGVKRKVHLTPDPAITLTPVKPQALDKILAREGLATLKKPIVGICLRDFSTSGQFHVHHYKQFDEKIVKNFKGVIAEVADYLTTVGEVLFIPMNTEPPDDDRMIAQDIIGMMKNPSAVKTVDHQYRPRELIGLLSKLDMVIGVRLHSLVLASAINTPVVGIGYGHKTKGFMKCIGQEKFYSDLESLKVQNILAKVKNVLSNNASIKEDLKCQVEHLQKLAQVNAKRATKLN